MLAPSPSQPPRPIPYGLVSLWDMINFSAALAHAALLTVDLKQGLTRLHALGDAAGSPPAASKKEAEDLLTTCANVFGSLDSHAVRERIETFERRLKAPPFTWSDFHGELLSLHDTIQSELKQHYFYHYPRDRGDKVISFDKDWRSIWPANRDVRNEALAAVDCYALDHPTASVFHSMRVAELGLRAVARERKIKVKNRLIEWATWQDILKELKKAADKIENRRAGPKKDADLAFYKGVIADMDSFRVEYRNLVMHTRATYDDLQALRAIERVREFMLRVSERIDENGKRKKK